MRVPDVEAADAAGEVDERVAVDVGERGAAASATTIGKVGRAAPRPRAPCARGSPGNAARARWCEARSSASRPRSHDIGGAGRTDVESPHGPLRPDDPAPARRGPDRDRPVRPGAAPAVERGRPRRPLLPRLPQLALPVHRRQAGAGGPDRAGRDRRRAVHPPPRRVRARLDARAREAARRPGREARREVELRPPRAADPLDRGLHRPRLGRPRDARAVERRQPADHDLPRDEDRAALVRAAHRAGRLALRQRRARLQVPGPARARRRAATGGTSSDPRHGRNGLRRPEGRPRAARGGARRALPRPAAGAGRDAEDVGVRARGRRRHRPGEPQGARPPAATPSSTSSRSSRASRPTSSA